MDNSPEMEHIEWDLPISDVQSSGKDNSQENWLDFSKLSLGTEMRNKIWEQENKEAIGFNKMSFKNDTVPLEPPGFLNMNGKVNSDEQSQNHRGKGPFFNQNQNMFDFNLRNNNMRNGFHGGNNFLNPNSPSFSPSFSPSHGQVTSPAVDSLHGGVNGRGENRFGQSGADGDIRVRRCFLFCVFHSNCLHLNYSCMLNVDLYRPGFRFQV